MRRVAVVLGFGLVLAGCTSRQITNTPRSAIEQLLLSGAVDLAMAKLDLPEVKGRRVFVDSTNLKAYDAEYIKVAARVRFAELGATLAEKAEEADLVAELASGGLGTEFKESVVGLPAFPVPNSPTPTPKLSAYSSTEQTAIFKLLVFLHEGGRFVSSHQYYAKFERNESIFLAWRFQRHDDLRTGWERAELANRERSGSPPEAPAKLPEAAPEVKPLLE